MIRFFRHNNDYIVLCPHRNPQRRFLCLKGKKNNKMRARFWEDMPDLNRLTVITLVDFLDAMKNNYTFLELYYLVGSSSSVHYVVDLRTGLQKEWRGSWRYVTGNTIRENMVKDD